MRYPSLPPIGGATLPRLDKRWTQASSPRLGSPIRRVWLHRWGGGSYSGVINEFLNVSSQASAHFVYAGETGRDAGKCVQMVPLSRKSWTEAFYNRSGVSIESADAIWLGHDPRGFCRLARMTAKLLHDLGLPPNWVHGPLISWGKGFSRHADGGALGGGHTQCPTTDLDLWWQFVGRVKQEHYRKAFRPTWEVR